MLTDQKLRIAWKGYLAELAAMQMAEHFSEQVVAERLQSISAIGFLRRPGLSLKIVPGWQRC
jgi:hypothetical protein